MATNRQKNIDDITKEIESLSRKVSGNLSPEENRLLQGVLQDDPSKFASTAQYNAVINNGKGYSDYNRIYNLSKELAELKGLEDELYTSALATRPGARSQTSGSALVGGVRERSVLSALV